MEFAAVIEQVIGKLDQAGIRYALIGGFATVLVGLALFVLLGRKVPWTWLLVLLVPMAVDGVLQAVTDYESSNIVRLLTGALAGSAAGYGAGMLIGNFFERPDEGKGDGQQ